MKRSFHIDDLPEKEVSIAALCQRSKTQKWSGMERTDSPGTLFLSGVYPSSLQTSYFKLQSLCIRAV